MGERNGDPGGGAGRKRERQRVRELERGEGRKMALRKEERHKINLRKGTVEQTLVE